MDKNREKKHERKLRNKTPSRTESAFEFDEFVEWKAIEKDVKRLKNDKILDAGCGIGKFTYKISEISSGQVIGLDFSKESIEIARKKFKNRKNTSFVVGDIFRLPFPSDFFDLVVSTQVIEHLPKGSWSKALEEIKRVLKPKGKIILTVFNFDIWKKIFSDKERFGSPSKVHYYNFSYKEFSRLLEKVFSENIEIRGIVNIRSLDILGWRDYFSSRSLLKLEEFISNTKLSYQLGRLLYAKVSTIKGS